MAVRQWRCSPRFSADAHKYTITYELCSIRMVRTKNCARRTSLGLEPPSSARNPRAPLAAGFEGQQAAAAVVQVCHAGSAATPNTCTMSHHVQGDQHAVEQVVPVCYAGCPDKCTMSHHTQKGGQKKRNPLPKPPGSRHVKCACGIRKTICKKCKGGSLCTHGIQRQWCMRAECGHGAARCEHGTQRSKCLRCGGTGVCKHGKVRCRCLDCKEEEQNAKQQ